MDERFGLVQHCFGKMQIIDLLMSVLPGKALHRGNQFLRLYG
jgi:hypothetical protein